MTDNDRSVYKTDNGWANKKHGNNKVTSYHETQRDAIDEAIKNLNNADGGELNIHGVNGKIRDKNTIGKKDPYPPKG